MRLAFGLKQKETEKQNNIDLLSNSPQLSGQKHIISFKIALLLLLLPKNLLEMVTHTKLQ